MGRHSNDDPPTFLAVLAELFGEKPRRQAGQSPLTGEHLPQHAAPDERGMHYDRSRFWEGGPRSRRFVTGGGDRERD